MHFGCEGVLASWPRCFVLFAPGLRLHLCVCLQLVVPPPPSTVEAIGGTSTMAAALPVIVPDPGAPLEHPGSDRAAAVVVDGGPAEVGFTATSESAL